MSKYEPLWAAIEGLDVESGTLAFSEIEELLGFPIDHSFLTYKKELIERGFEIGKISLKERTVRFARLPGGKA